MVNPVEIIIKKRGGGTIESKEFTEFVENYLSGNIPEYQMSAFLMASYFKGLSLDEAIDLTKVYINSGKKLSFDANLNTVDKHSTGGVGDKITLMLAPIVAACGGVIPMISGRGLGHTGGTLDKLESIPGLSTSFDEKDFRSIIKQIGFSIIQQSKQLVPADKRIYALRDVTGTVESIGLITASIMSKKIAEGAQNLVIDLKTGSGAFIKTLDDAKILGNYLKTTGEALGQKVCVVYSNMNAPLGNFIGNALEVKETIDYLRGKKINDIHVLTKKLATEMLLLANVFADQTEAENKVEEVIANGKALQKFAEFIEAQSGNPKVCEDTSLLPQAKFKTKVYANQSGYVKAVDSQSIGYALVDIGAGRKTLDSKLDYSSGAEMYPKIGTKLNKGDVIGFVYANNENAAQIASKRISECYTITDEAIEAENLILGTNK